MLKKMRNYIRRDFIYTVTIFIIVIISFLITKLPLVNGFTYEFAFIINIILLLLYPIAFKFNKKLNLYKSYLFLIIPIIIQLFTIKNLCDPFKGFFFYLLIPFTTLFLIYFLLKYLKNNRIIKYYIVIFLSLLSELYLLYSQPQIFFYNSFWGYFQGSLYDIDFSISKPLIWLSAFKIINGVILYIIINIQSSQKENIKKEKIILAFLIITSISIYFNQSDLGLISTHNSIQKILLGHYKTKHFNIYYANNYRIRKEIKIIAKEHEMELSELEKMYNIKWKTKIDSYIFKDSIQKKQLMGAGNTLLAKPWLQEIYINYSSQFPVSHLKHELSHIIASKFSNRFLKIPMKFGIIPQMGIVEGFAVSSEDEKDELTLFEQMAILKRINKFPPLEKMVSFNNFWSYNSFFAYKTVGGFLKFLKIRYGIEKLKKLYRKESFKLAYNKNILELKHEYLKFLDKVKIDKKYIFQIKDNYSHSSIFKRVCPHDIQEIKDSTIKLIQNKSFDMGIKKAEELIKLEPLNISHKIYLARLSMKYGRYNKALGYLKDLKSNSKIENYYISKLKADIFWFKNLPNKSLEIYKKLITENISSSQYREIYIKIKALENENIEKMVYNYLLKREYLAPYLFYFDNIKLKQISFNIVNYLYGRYYYNNEKYKEAIFFLNKINDEMPYYLVIEILKMKISSYFLIKNYKLSIQYSDELIKISKTDGIKEFAKNWIKYCKYFKYYLHNKYQ